MFSRFAALRVLLADSEASVIAEYDRELAKVMVPVVKGIADEMRERAGKDPENAAVLLKSADDMVRKASSYSWVAPVVSYCRKFPYVSVEDVLSELFMFVIHGTDGRALVKTLPEGVARKFPTFLHKDGVPVGWDDIQMYWYTSVHGAAVDIVRKQIKQQARDPEIIQTDLADRAAPPEDVVEEVVDDELGRLKSFMRQKARNPEEGKLFAILLDAVIENDYLTEQGKKKFVGVMKKLPTSAPNRDNEDFWRGVWDKMRPHVCAFFQRMFAEKGIRMTQQQKKVVCSSEGVDRVARRLFASEVRLAIARFVLGRGGIREELLAGDFISPKAMVDRLREERKKQAMIERVARSVM
jgi:hypothetical protein